MNAKRPRTRALRTALTAFYAGAVALSLLLLLLLSACAGIVPASP